MSALSTGAGILRERPGLLLCETEPPRAGSGSPTKKLPVLIWLNPNRKSPVDTCAFAAAFQGRS